MSSIQLVRQPVVLIAKQAVSQIGQQAVAQLCCGASALGDGVVL